MKLSIVIPCYNCSKTIERLFNSILDNQLDKEDYEVIVCDDKSTDGFLNIVKTYEDKMNIVYCTTIRNVHCPGNTRQAALPYIKGDWFTFVDNDDIFEPDVFKKVLKYIEDNKLEYTLVTNFRAYDFETGEYTRTFEGEGTDTWLHGKYFNRVNTLEKFGCRFKDDMFSHEDLYFNSWNLSRLVTLNRDYDYYPIYTYKWVNNPNSLSRSYFNEKYFYIEVYLEDFLMGCSYPYFDMFNTTTNPNAKMFAWNQIMMTLLHGYFYYQASLFSLGQNETFEGSYNALRSFKRKIIKELKVDVSDIINYIYSDPIKYDNIKANCRPGSNPFVEIQSFRDFIMNL
jgi:glycosyltransferase involved in cell wall biosynthesis